MLASVECSACGSPRLAVCGLVVVPVDSKWSVVAALLLLSACADDAKPAPSECVGPRAAFDVQISAADGALPDDTQLTVKFSSGEEVYSVAAPERPLEAVRCTQTPADASVASLRCALWTDGPARVDVTATGYLPLEVQLVHETDDCGIKTVQEALVIQRPPVE